MEDGMNITWDTTSYQQAIAARDGAYGTLTTPDLDMLRQRFISGNDLVINEGGAVFQQEFEAPPLSISRSKLSNKKWKGKYYI